jgi:hypothetical protein
MFKLFSGHFWDRELVSGTNRFLQMISGQVNVLGVRKEDIAELQVGARLHPLRRFEVEDGLKALNAQFEVGRTRSPKIFG